MTVGSLEQSDKTETNKRRYVKRITTKTHTFESNRIKSTSQKGDRIRERGEGEGEGERGRCRYALT